MGQSFCHFCIKKRNLLLGIIFHCFLHHTIKTGAATEAGLRVVMENLGWHMRLPSPEKSEGNGPLCPADLKCWLLSFPMFVAWRYGLGGVQTACTEL